MNIKQFKKGFPIWWNMRKNKVRDAILVFFYAVYVFIIIIGSVLSIVSWLKWFNNESGFMVDVIAPVSATVFLLFFGTMLIVWVKRVIKECCEFGKD